MFFVARIKNVRGRWLLEGDSDSEPGYEARKIHDSRQWTKYHNPADARTGLWLNEMTRYFSRGEIVSMRPHTTNR